MPSNDRPMDLSQMRCFNHLQREAAARCPECRRFFCRECITEHEDRVICASCLKKLVSVSGPKKFQWTSLILFFESMAAFFVVWLLFYWMGQILVSLPPSVHDGLVWKTPVQDANE